MGVRGRFLSLGAAPGPPYTLTYALIGGGGCGGSSVSSWGGSGGGGAVVIIS